MRSIVAVRCIVSKLTSRNYILNLKDMGIIVKIEIKDKPENLDK